MADAMQPAGWRQFRYVRLPQLSDVEQITYEHPAHNRLVKQIVFNLGKLADCTILRYKDLLKDKDKNLNMRGQLGPPEALASALKYLNTEFRENHPDAGGRTRPAFSWTFVRIVPWEQDDLFWRLIWDTLGASPDSFVRMLDCHDWEDAAGKVAQAMNVFEPSATSRSHRAPDLLVLVGAEEFAESLSTSAIPESRELAAAEILERLPPKLKPSPTAEPFVGSLRIVLLPRYATERPAPKRIHIPAEVMRLSVFEGAFSQNMAAAVLELPGVETRKELKRLVKKQWVRRAARQGHTQYYVLQRYANDFAPAKKADLHLRAGHSLAPYAARRQCPSIGLDVALLPEHQNEARFHFEQALDLANKAGGVAVDTAREARYALQQHRLQTTIPSWPALGNMTVKARAAEVVVSLLDRIGNDHRLHPLHWGQAGRALGLRAGELAGEAQNNPSKQQEVAVLRQRAEDCFRNALSSGEGYSKIVLQTYLADYLFKNNEQDEAIGIMREVVQEARSIPPLKDGQGPGLLGESFEQAGDAEPDNSVAVVYYRTGARVASSHQQNWIKAAGSEEYPSSDLVAGPTAHGIAGLARSTGKARGAVEAAPEYVKARWSKGLTALRRREDLDVVMGAIDRLRRWGETPAPPGRKRNS